MSIIIPSYLPAPKKVAEDIVKRLKKRWVSLGGMRPLGDILLESDSGWVVGSTVWRATLGMPDTDTDLDIVFGTEKSMRDAYKRIQDWHQTLSDGRWSFKGDKGYSPTACRVVSGTRTLVDLYMPSPITVTVEEYILGFSEVHQRCGLRPDGTLFRGILRGDAPK